MFPISQAVEDYHNHVASIAVAILSEYHELFGKQLPDQGATDHQTLEEQRRQLNFELNSSGKYFAFKEQLKAGIHCAVSLPCSFYPGSFSVRNCCFMVIT